MLSRAEQAENTFSPHQKLGCEGEWRPWELGFIHEGNGSRPVAMAVKQRADNAAINDAWTAHFQVFKRIFQQGKDVLWDNIPGGQHMMYHGRARSLSGSTWKCLVLAWKLHCSRKAIFDPEALQMQPIFRSGACRVASSLA